MAGTLWRQSPFLCSDLETEMKERLCRRRRRSTVSRAAQQPDTLPQNRERHGSAHLRSLEGARARVCMYVQVRVRVCVRAHIYINQNKISLPLSGPFYFPFA